MYETINGPVFEISDRVRLIRAVEIVNLTVKKPKGDKKQVELVYPQCTTGKVIKAAKSSKKLTIRLDDGVLVTAMKIDLVTTT